MKNSSPNAEATDHTTSLLSAEREGKVLPEDDVFASLKDLAAQARLHILRAEMLTELQLLLGCGNENLSSM